MLITNQWRGQKCIFLLLLEGGQTCKFYQNLVDLIFFSGNCISLVGFCPKPLPAFTIADVPRPVDVSFIADQQCQMPLPHVS
jgi:hypothetical protein